MQHRVARHQGDNVKEAHDDHIGAALIYLLVEAAAEQNPKTESIARVFVEAGSPQARAREILAAEISDSGV